MDLNEALSDLCGKHRTEQVPPEAHRFVADIHTKFEQQILDLAQGQRIPDVHHNRQADHFGR